MLIRWWKGPPIIVLIPPEPVRIRVGKSRINVVCQIPAGSIRGIPLTEERKAFLTRQGVDRNLIRSGRVFDVSDALGTKFDTEREATNALAAELGFSEKDLGKMVDAKRNLAKFQPSNRTERIAKRGLESLFYSKAPKKGAGRPSKILAVERQEMRARATHLQAAGQGREEVVSQLAEEYGLGLSYTRRILEDRPKPEVTP